MSEALTAKILALREDNGRRRLQVVKREQVGNLFHFQA